MDDVGFLVKVEEFVVFFQEFFVMEIIVFKIVRFFIEVFKSIEYLEEDVQKFVQEGVLGLYIDVLLLDFENMLCDEELF